MYLVCRLLGHKGQSMRERKGCDRCHDKVNTYDDKTGFELLKTSNVEERNELISLYRTMHLTLGA